MQDYEESRVRKLAAALQKQGVPADVRERILEGGIEVRRGCSKEERAAWLFGAMERMDRELDFETRRAVRERCACCLGGKRATISRAIARDNETLGERVRAANEARFVFGHSVTEVEDGMVLVQFFPDGLMAYDCPCLPLLTQPISITYCYCCAGHVKRHIQMALGRKVEVRVASSALSSGGSEPCRFLCRLLT